MSKTYYVKARGRVAGPFPVERLRAMAQQGQLSRIHDVSADGKKWNKASHFPELFKAEAQAEGSNSNASRGSSDKSNANGSVASGKKRRRTSEKGNVIPPVSDEGGWHYGINGQSAGPVSESVIVDLIRKGKLSANDRVWKATFDDWKAVGELQQLAVLLPSPGGNNPSSSYGELSQTNESRGNQLDWDAHRGGISQSLATIVPWLYFISVLIALYCFGLLYLFITTLATAYRLNNASLVGTSVGIFISIVTIAFGGYFLQRFASCSNRFVLTENTEFLRDAILWLKRFWLLIGITLVVIIVVSMATYAYVLATTGQVFGA